METLNLAKELKLQYDSCNYIEKRKMLLNEIIQLTELENIYFYRQNGYFQPLFTNLGISKLDIQECLLTNNKDFKCEVCEKGGLMLSYIKYNNNFTVENLYETASGDYVEYLPFTKYELDLLELIFENMNLIDFDDEEDEDGDYLYDLSIVLKIFSDLKIAFILHTDCDSSTEIVIALSNFLIENNTDFTSFFNLIDISNYNEEHITVFNWIKSHFILSE